MTTLTWQEARADAVEAEIDNIEAAILSLQRLQGMFRDGGETTQGIRLMLDQLAVESLNRRNTVDRLRDGKSV